MGAALHSETAFPKPGFDLGDGADGHEVLERLALSRLTHGDGVVVIGLDAIRDRLGSRWAAKREQIWEGVERHLEHRLKPGDSHARVGDVELLLATESTPQAAVGRGLYLLRELLVFFLGDQKPCDMKISQVITSPSGAVMLLPLGPAEIAAAAQGGDSRLSARAVTPLSGPVSTSMAAAREILKPQVSAPHDTLKPVSFAASDGRTLEVRFEFDQVFNLGVGDFASSALSVRPEVWETPGAGRLGPKWRRQLAFADVLRIDKAALDAAGAICAQADSPAVIVPVSLDTLVCARGAAAVADRFAAMAPGASAHLVCEIVGVDQGTPPSHLTEAMALLRRHYKAVVVRSLADRGCIEVMAACRPQAISLDCENLPVDPRALLIAMSNFRKSVKPICKSTLMLGLPSMEARRLAAAAGATQASVRNPIRRRAAA